MSKTQPNGVVCGVVSSGHDVPFIKTETPENRQFTVSVLSKVYYPPGFSRKVLAEAVATFLLVFVTCGSAALTTSDDRKVSQLGASVAGGMIVTVMIYAVGHISGAHMNPAVTIAFASVGHFPWVQMSPMTLVIVVNWRRLWLSGRREGWERKLKTERKNWQGSKASTEKEDGVQSSVKLLLATPLN